MSGRFPGLHQYFVVMLKETVPCSLSLMLGPAETRALHIQLNLCPTPSSTHNIL